MNYFEVDVLPVKASQARRVMSSGVDVMRKFEAHRLTYVSDRVLEPGDVVVVPYGEKADRVGLVVGGAPLRQVRPLERQGVVFREILDVF